ncbi:cytochrome c oxidase subunit II [Phenylobacterium sp. J426]|uniref:cytochrome c oxidase subunit II n=1 Tax=Phenylobacterium sp. J426 TaxID=2898439 RepID=UPI0021517F57|nr:cytochrome c oxidase subunit II [Phenylobacterium sp. J426]MCR5875324.1 cytochrome c oxidase subunit II [Phenylobacterium sp. J426]
MSGLGDILSGWPPPVLDPAGPFAAPVTVLAWALFAMGAGVLALVIGATAIAIFGPRRWRARLGHERLVWIGGLAFPVVVLSALLIWGLTLTRDLSAPPQPGEVRIRVTGEMWWWRVAYLDSEGREAIQDANEIHLPAGQPVTLELEAADVIHSLWIPRLSGKVDMIPGRRNLMRIEAARPGVYPAQCAEFCGGPHALMGLVVVAHEPAAFEAWRSRRLQPPPQASTPGAATFLAAGCGACHTVRGTPANGTAGPDLTHIGSRRTLGAGILPNRQGTLAAWIADSQAIKPGNRMPSYPVLSGSEVRLIAAWLETLE